jgi:hypothetical protein
MYTEIPLGPAQATACTLAFAHKYNACTFACKQKYNAADVKKEEEENKYNAADVKKIQ